MTAFSGGSNAVTGTGSEWQLAVTGTWVLGDLYTILLIDSQTGVTSQFGAGFVTGIQPVQVMTFNNKVYAIAGSTVYFSGVNQPTVWNDPNGDFNGFVTMTDYFATTENLVAMAAYQGRLAFFSRFTTQIFVTDPNPINWVQSQVMQNIGTFATLSVQSMGDLDVLFLSDTGIRSLRVRDQSLNAFVNDIGSPLDLLVQANLMGGTSTSNAAANGIIEPQSGRYWLYLNGIIYVLSFFPSSKITAWATYTPTYYSTKDGNQHSFVASQMAVFQGQVYIRATSDEGDIVLQYAGPTKEQYDATVASFSTTWLDLKMPGTNKKAEGLDGALFGGWIVSVGMDPQTGILNPIIDTNTPTFLLGSVPVTGDGFHVKIAASTTGDAKAKVSSLVFHYEKAEEK